MTDKTIKQDNNIQDDPKEEIKYPKQVFFIIGNEFCERFCFYGNKAVLAIYLNTILQYSENDATIIFHFFVMFSYFFPIVGALIADCFLGKFRTILYLGILYVIGNSILSAASIMSLQINHKFFSLLGLFLLAVGTGGIKPCVSAFGGDQFVLPQQEKQLASFFSIFYFSINTGSLLSTYVTPELRVMKCFGENSCYPLAFGVPAALMVTALVLFVCGIPFYTIKNPRGNILIDVSKCIGQGIRQKIFSKVKKDHWLDYAKDYYDHNLVEDTKTLFEVIYLLSPSIMFCALYEQQGSRWTFQGTHMNRQFFGFTLKPDQMHILDPLTIIIFIPIFEFAIYPALAKMKLIRTFLDKLFWGGVLAAIAFAMSAIVEYNVQKAYAVLPQAGEAQLRIYNSYNCSLHINATNGDRKYSWNIDSMGLLEDKSIPVTVTSDLLYSAAFAGIDCPSLSPISEGKLTLFEEEAISFITTQQNDASDYKLDIVRLDDKFDDVSKSDDSQPKFRIIYDIRTRSSLTVSGYDSNQTAFLLPDEHVIDSIVVRYDRTYTVLHDNKTVLTDLQLHMGGVYSLLLPSSPDNEAKLFTITPANDVHIFWQIPQIFVISIAEVIFNITCLELSYSQAPQSMKSIISSFWLLTNSFGNLIIIVVSALTVDVPQVYMLSAFSMVMVVVMGLFLIISRGYSKITKTITNK